MNKDGAQFAAIFRRPWFGAVAGTGKTIRRIAAGSQKPELAILG